MALIITVPVLPSSVNTSFPGTENPLSLGGTVLLGGNDFLDWQNPQSTGGSPGICWGTGASPTNDNDNIFVLKQASYSISPTKHWSRITIRKAVGYTPPSTHEVECLLGFSGGAHLAKGYEMDCGFGVAVQPVRWNGALNDFDVAVFTTLSGTAFTVGDGDDVFTEFDSTSGSPVISLWQNPIGSVTTILASAPSFKITDTTAGKILSGMPGAGFFARPGTGLDMSKYCISNYSAGNA